MCTLIANFIQCYEAVFAPFLIPFCTFVTLTCFNQKIKILDKDTLTKNKVSFFKL